MKTLYVAAQNFLTREWIPVAELAEQSDGYVFRYTKGAARLPGFTGLGRMQALDQSYYSPVLFPFFANRLIPRSRPEFRDYLRWVGLDTSPSSPMELLAITGGVRATDGYQLIAPPRTDENGLKLEFFARGLRHLPAEVLNLLYSKKVDEQVFLMKDIQNDKDQLALAIRTADPMPMLVGYVPRYYCNGIVRLLDLSCAKVNIKIKRINSDAPYDMKLLLSVEASPPNGFGLMDDVTDFLPFNAKAAERLSNKALSKTHLDLFGD